MSVAAASKPALWSPPGLGDRLAVAVDEHRRAARHGVVVDLAACAGRMTRTVAAAAKHDVRLLYAVKACANRRALALAARHGLGFDITNVAELAAATAAAPGAPMSLTAPAVALEDDEPLRRAVATGKLRRHHDSLGQLEAAARATPGIPLGVRVSLDEVDVPAGLPVYRPSRFGVQLGHLSPARELAAAHGSALRWLHLHNGSEENDLASFVFAAREVLRAARAADLEVTALDLGGGLLVDDEPMALDSYFAAIRAAAGPDIELTLEPGRFWLTDCVVLLTQVLDVKEAGGRTCLVLDVGLMSHLQWSAALRLPALPPVAQPWRIVGRSCFEEDAIEDDEIIPLGPAVAMPEIGDWFAIGNITGYSLELACDFNGIRRPPVTWLAP